MRVSSLTHRIIAGLVSSVFAAQSVFGSSPETNLWAERRRAHRGTAARLLASGAGPSASPAFVGLPAPPLPDFRSFGSAGTDGVDGVDGVIGKADLLAALSPALGTIRRVSAKGRPFGGAPLVIHIHDVHRHAEAQRNIRDAVSALLKTGRVDLLALEGSTEEIRLQPFVDFPDRRAVALSADYLLRDNQISGPIHAALTAKGPLPRVLGIDDPVHYGANVQAYRDSAWRRESALQDLHARRAAIDAEKQTVFSSALLVLDQTVGAYRAGKLNLGEYVDAMDKILSPLNRPVGPPKSPVRSTSPFPAGENVRGPELSNRYFGFPQVERFHRTWKAEHALDFARVERERTCLIEQLTPRLTPAESQTFIAQCVAHKTGRVRHADFYSQLKESCGRKGILFSDYPEMDAYVRYVLQADSLDPDGLSMEISQWETAGYDALIQTAAERALLFRSRAIWLTEKLLNFALTPEEWKEYLSTVPRVNFGIDLSTFEAFYREAQFRDKSMAVKLMSALNTSAGPPKGPLNRNSNGPPRPRVAILVTGGFHADGIGAHLREAGATVVSFVPKIETVEIDGSPTYLSVFTQEKSPLEKLVESEKLFLAQTPWSEALRKIVVPALVALACVLVESMGGFDVNAAYASLDGMGRLSSLQPSGDAVRAVLSGAFGAVAIRASGSAAGLKSFSLELRSPSGTAILLDRGRKLLAAGKSYLARLAHSLPDVGTVVLEEWKGSPSEKWSPLSLLEGRLSSILLSVLFLTDTVTGLTLLPWVGLMGLGQWGFIRRHSNLSPGQIYARTLGLFLIHLMTLAGVSLGDSVSARLVYGFIAALATHVVWNTLAEFGRQSVWWAGDYRLMVDAGSAGSMTAPDRYSFGYGPVSREILPEAQRGSSLSFREIKKFHDLLMKYLKQERRDKYKPAVARTSERMAIYSEAVKLDSSLATTGREKDWEWLADAVQWAEFLSEVTWRIYVPRNQCPAVLGKTGAIPLIEPNRYLRVRYLGQDIWLGHASSAGSGESHSKNPSWIQTPGLIYIDALGIKNYTDRWWKQIDRKTYSPLVHLWHHLFLNSGLTYGAFSESIMENEIRVRLAEEKQRVFAAQVSRRGRSELTWAEILGVVAAADWRWREELDPFYTSLKVDLPLEQKNGILDEAALRVLSSVDGVVEYMRYWAGDSETASSEDREMDEKAHLAYAMGVSFVFGLTSDAFDSKGGDPVRAIASTYLLYTIARVLDLPLNRLDVGVDLESLIPLVGTVLTGDYANFASLRGLLERVRGRLGVPPEARFQRLFRRPPSAEEIEELYSSVPLVQTVFNGSRKSLDSDATALTRRAALKKNWLAFFERMNKNVFSATSAVPENVRLFCVEAFQLAELCESVITASDGTAPWDGMAGLFNALRKKSAQFGANEEVATVMALVEDVFNSTADQLFWASVRAIESKINPGEVEDAIRRLLALDSHVLLMEWVRPEYGIYLDDLLTGARSVLAAQGPYGIEAILAKRTLFGLDPVEAQVLQTLSDQKSGPPMAGLLGEEDLLCLKEKLGRSFPKEFSARVAAITENVDDVDHGTEIAVSPELSLGNWIEWGPRALFSIDRFLKEREKGNLPGNWKQLRGRWGGLYRGRMGRGRVYVRFCADGTDKDQRKAILMILALGPKADYTDDATRGTMNWNIANILDRYAAADTRQHPEFRKFIPLADMREKNAVAVPLRGSPNTNPGRAASLWGTRLWEKLRGHEHGSEYPLFAPGVALAGALLWGGSVWFLVGPPLAGFLAPWAGTLYGLVFIASHAPLLTPDSWRPKTQIPVDWKNVMTLALIQGATITATLWGMAGVAVAGVAPPLLFHMGVLLGIAGALWHGSIDGWFDPGNPIVRAAEAIGARLSRSLAGRAVRGFRHRWDTEISHRRAGGTVGLRAMAPALRSLVAVPLFAAIFLCPALAIPRPNVIAGQEPAGSATRGIFNQFVVSQLAERPISLGVGGMREIVSRSAKRMADGPASADLSTGPWPGPLMAGTKILMVDGRSLEEESHRLNLLGLMNRRADLVVVTESPFFAGPAGRVIHLPQAFASPAASTDPARSVYLSEIRKALGASHSAVRLLHTPHLVLNVDGLSSTDPLVAAAGDAWVVLLDSLRTFPAATGWGQILNALKAYDQAA